MGQLDDSWDGDDVIVIITAPSRVSAERVVQEIANAGRYNIDGMIDGSAVYSRQNDGHLEEVRVRLVGQRGYQVVKKIT